MAAPISPSNPPDAASSGTITSPRPKRQGPTAGQVLVVTSVMFTFISFWRTAAIVLCDLASTAYYIGGIVESQIGKAAPWFILARDALQLRACGASTSRAAPCSSAAACIASSRRRWGAGWPGWRSRRSCSTTS